MSSDTTGRRISLFCVGATIAVFCGLLAVLAFNLATMMMNPALHGDQYWADVRERLGRHLELLGLMVGGGIGAAIGVVLMARAIFGRFRATEPLP